MHKYFKCVRLAGAGRANGSASSSARRALSLNQNSRKFSRRIGLLPSQLLDHLVSKCLKYPYCPLECSLRQVWNLAHMSIFDDLDFKIRGLTLYCASIDWVCLLPSCSTRRAVRFVCGTYLGSRGMIGSRLLLCLRGRTIRSAVCGGR